MPGGIETEIHLTGRDTGGAFCLLVDRPPAGWALPPHRHANEAETIHILEGTFEVEVEGAPTRLAAGQTIHVPQGATHSTRNLAPAPSRRLVIFSPAGLEEFFLDVGLPTPDGPHDPATVLASATNHGWEFDARSRRR